MREFAFAVAIMATGGFTGAAAQNTQSGDDLDRYQRYQQTPAVSARYGDVPIKLDAPALVPGRATLTDQRALEAFLASAARGSKHLVLGSLGKSQQGRDIPFVVATEEGHASAADIPRIRADEDSAFVELMECTRAIGHVRCR